MKKVLNFYRPRNYPAFSSQSYCKYKITTRKSCKWQFTSHESSLDPPSSARAMRNKKKTFQIVMSPHGVGWTYRPVAVRTFISWILLPAILVVKIAGSQKCKIVCKQCAQRARLNRMSSQCVSISIASLSSTQRTMTTGNFDHQNGG